MSDRTKVSNKGQVVIPKRLRDRKGWRAGTELVVEERPDGLLLKQKSGLRPTTIDEVIGIAGYKGPPKTLKDMERGIEEGMRDRARKKGWLK